MEVITPEEARAVLDEAAVAHVAVISEGEPYVTPISYVLDGMVLRFRTAPGRRLTALEAGGTACVEAYLMGEEGSWLSAVAWGEASIEDDDAVIQDTVKGFYEKYEDLMGDPFSVSRLQPAVSLIRVVSVEIDRITGMSSGGGFRPRLRPGRL